MDRLRTMAAALTAAGRPETGLLFVASFDGVLAEYRSNPAAARVTSARLERLRYLQQLPGVAVAVISGRPIRELYTRVPLGDEGFYVGLHGLEIAGPAFTWVCP